MIQNETIYVHKKIMTIYKKKKIEVLQRHIAKFSYCLYLSKTLDQILVIFCFYKEIYL